MRKKGFKLNGKQQYALNIMLAGKNVFLTGEAGTGKSFVLQRFIESAKDRNVLVCAPSGVAAINVGGVTIHRAFMAPIKPYIGGEIEIPEVVKNADVVIIDEISMCRIDLFDYVSTIILNINKNRKNHKDEKTDPIQIIVVGDFYQLPPVIAERDARILKEHYGNNIGSAFAFQSENWSKFDFVSIVLKDIVRQNDQEFVHALNLARIGNSECINFIRSNSSKKKIDKAIVLSSTNRSADEINQTELGKVREKPFRFEAIETGEVKESDRATSKSLVLKKGCRVMSIINDVVEDKFQNGTLGTVASINREKKEVIVDFDNGYTATVKMHRWSIENYRVEATVSKGKKIKHIEKVEIGSFTQLPLKLAYAITIHKSQGKTYDAVNLYTKCWQAGQLYVALSRVTSVAQLYLMDEIRNDYLVTAKDVQDFYKSLDTDDNITNDLKSFNQAAEKKIDQSYEDNYNVRFVENVSTVLQQKGMSWYRLSKLTGIPESSLADLRNFRKKEIGLSKAAKIAGALGVKIDSLLY